MNIVQISFQDQILHTQIILGEEHFCRSRGMHKHSLSVRVDDNFPKRMGMTLTAKQLIFVSKTNVIIFMQMQFFYYAVSEKQISQDCTCFHIDYHNRGQWKFLVVSTDEIPFAICGNKGLTLTTIIFNISVFASCLFCAATSQKYKRYQLK